jgi:hypothetical protein
MCWIRVVLSRRTECPAFGHDLHERARHPAAACRRIRCIARSGRSVFSPSQVAFQSQPDSWRGIQYYSAVNRNRATRRVHGGALIILACLAFFLIEGAHEAPSPLWGILFTLALIGCAEDPVNRNIAILQSPTITPEQKAAARQFLQWKRAQNQRDLEFQRQKDLAESYGRAAGAASTARYDEQQVQLDRIEQQTRDLQQDLDNIQAQQINHPVYYPASQRICLTFFPLGWLPPGGSR